MLKQFLVQVCILVILKFKTVHSYGENRCKEALVIVTTSANNNNAFAAFDGILAPDHDCTSAPCTPIDIMDSTTQDYWITLKLASATYLRTIVFLTDIAQNTLDYATMTRTVGTSSDREDTVFNRPIHAPTANYPSMIADLDFYGQGAITSYIHWRSDQPFTVDEILCYKEQRVQLEEFVTLAAPWGLGRNSHITFQTSDPSSTCLTNTSQFIDYDFTVSKKIYKVIALVGIDPGGDFYDEINEGRWVQTQIRGGANEDCNNNDPDDLGFDCSLTDEGTNIKIEFQDAGETLCGLILLEDGIWCTGLTDQLTPEATIDGSGTFTYQYDIGGPQIKIRQPNVHVDRPYCNGSGSETISGIESIAPVSNGFYVFEVPIPVPITYRATETTMIDFVISAGGESVNMQFQIFNPCFTTQIDTSAPTFPLNNEFDVFYDDYDPSTYTVGSFSDTVSLAYSPGGDPLCGFRGYTFEQSYFLPITSHTNGIWTFVNERAVVDAAPVSTHESRSLDVFLLDYPSIVETVNYKIFYKEFCERTVIYFEIEPEDITILHGAGDQSQYLGQLLNSEALHALDEDLCGVQPTFPSTEVEFITVPLFTTDSGETAGFVSFVATRANNGILTWSLVAVDQTDPNFGMWEVTIDFSLTDWPTQEYQRSFNLTQFGLEPVDFTDRYILSTVTEFTFTSTLTLVTADPAMTIGDFNVAKTAAIPGLPLTMSGDDFIWTKDAEITSNVYTVNIQVEHSDLIAQNIFLVNVYGVSFEVGDLAYVINNELVQYSFEPIVVTDSLGNLVPSTDFDYEATIDGQDLSTVTTIDFDSILKQFDIQVSDTVFSGSYTILITATCVDSSVIELIGQKVEKSFVLTLYSNSGFAIDDPQSYLAGSGLQHFFITAVNQVPTTPTLQFTYQSEYLGSEALPEGMIQFDDQLLRYSLETDDITLPPVSSFRVQATSSDPAWPVDYALVRPFELHTYTKESGAFSSPDKVYVVNNEVATHTMQFPSYTPPIYGTFAYSAQKVEVDETTGLDVFSELPTFILLDDQDPEYLIFSIGQNNRRRMSAINGSIGSTYSIVVYAEIEPGSSVQSLDGSIIEARFDLSLYSYSFDIANLNYTLNDSIVEFPIAQPALVPSTGSLIPFTFSTKLLTGEDLPEDLVQFDATTQTFTVQSRDQQLAATYEIEVNATSTDSRWLIQTLNTTFNLTAFKSTYVFNNTSVVSQNTTDDGTQLHFSFDYSFEQNLNTDVDFDIQLKPMIEHMQSPIVTVFDNHGHNQISFDKKNQCIHINPTIRYGNYLIDVEVRDFEKEGETFAQQYELNVIITLPDDNEIEDQDDTEEDIESPTLSIESISEYGIVTVKFTKKMLEIQNLALINDTAIALRIETENEHFLESGKLDFTWNTTQFTEDELKLHIVWENPNYVSQNLNRDTLFLKVINPSILLDKEHFQGIRNKTEVFSRIQYQVVAGDAIANLVMITQSSETMLITIVGANLILQTFLMFSLSMIWGLVNGLMIIAYFPLLNILIPANVLICYRLFYTIATFDFFPLELIYGSFEESMAPYDESDEKPLHCSVSTQEAGYVSSNPIFNTVDVLTFLALIIAFAIVLKLLKFVFYKFPRIEYKIQKLWGQIFWNAFLRLFIEEFQIISISCFIKLYAINFGNVFEGVSSVYGVLGIGIVITCPLMVWRFLYREVDSQHSTRAQFSSLNEDLKKDKHSILFLVFFMFRRVVIAAIIVCVYTHPGIQTQLFLFQILIIVIYQGWVKPFRKTSRNSLEWTNEILILFNSYFLFIYSDFVAEPEVRYLFGWINLGILMFMCVFNLMCIIQDMIGNVRHKMRQKKIIQLAKNRVALGQELDDTKILELSQMYDNFKANDNWNGLQLKSSKLSKKQKLKQKMLGVIEEEVPEPFESQQMSEASSVLAYENRDIPHQHNRLESIDYDHMQKQIEFHKGRNNQNMYASQTFGIGQSGLYGNAQNQSRKTPNSRAFSTLYAPKETGIEKVGFQTGEKNDYIDKWSTTQFDQREIGFLKADVPSFHVDDRRFDNGSEGNESSEGSESDEEGEEEEEEEESKQCEVAWTNPAIDDYYARRRNGIDATAASNFYLKDAIEEEKMTEPVPVDNLYKLHLDSIQGQIQELKQKFVEKNAPKVPIPPVRKMKSQVGLQVKFDENFVSKKSFSKRKERQRKQRQQRQQRQDNGTVLSAPCEVPGNFNTPQPKSFQESKFNAFVYFRSTPFKKQ